MFKLIKKVTNSFQNPNEVIENIHNEFDSASERLLAEAKEIIANNNKADKGERLMSLGFESSLPVKQSLENKEKEKIAKKIEYYETYYPNNKFITEKEVERICKKYGLLFGEARYYKGDIPEKNLLEIEDFKLREEDKEKRSNMDDYIQIKGQPWYLYHPLDLNDVPKNMFMYSYKKPFKICAPEKDFNTEYMEVRNGYKLEYDPIVLQPVNEGYLIVSKWGIEGEDKNLVNEKMN